LFQLILKFAVDIQQVQYLFWLKIFSLSSDIHRWLSPILCNICRERSFMTPVVRIK
jgi:hypothetical protein